MVLSRKGIIPSIGSFAGVALCASVVVLPLFSGGSTPFGAMVLRLAVVGLFLLVLLEREFSLAPEPLVKPLAALAVLALLGVLQSLPWPRGLVESVSPAHLALADGNALALGEPEATHVALSLYPAASRRVALECLVFAALGIAAHAIGRSRARRAWLAVAVIGAAGLQVLLGLRPWLGGLVPRLRGSFANPDHLCILLEVAACVACAGVYWAVSTRRFRGEAALRALGVLLWGTVLLLLLSAIAFTGSRSGALAILVGLFAQFTVASRNLRWRALAAAGTTGLAVAGFLAWIGGARSFGRLASTSWFEVVWGARSTVWWESLELIRRFPLLGTGLGTFEQAFPLVQPASIQGALWSKAHNDFLEWVVTGGAVAAGVVAAAIIFLVKALGSRLRSVSGAEDRAALSAALGSLAAVAVHELFDFGLSLSANAFVLTVVVAASLAVRTDS